MTDASSAVLYSTTATVALVHTLVGVDHTLPFVVLGKARGWSLSRTLMVTAACGAGHVLASLVLAALAAAFGLSLQHLEGIDATRGDLAAGSLVLFGLLYMASTFYRRRHRHPLPADHASTARVIWSLFIIFVLGPCEPLLPLLAAPAVAGDPLTFAGMLTLFSALTIGTMLGVVCLAFLGLRLVHLQSLERYANPLAGAAIAISGLLIFAFGI